MNFQNLVNAEYSELVAFLTRLNGQQHRFTWYDRGRDQLGNFGGTPLVAGASQTGRSLNIDGCSSSVTDWIKAGDWFSVNGELKMATTDADSDGGGAATLNFMPGLRSAPADNAPITTVNPAGQFLLAAPEAGWTRKLPDFADLQIDAIEDIA